MKQRYQILLVVCVAVAALWLEGCSLVKKESAATEQPNGSITYEKGSDFVGVVKSVDTTGQKITFYDTAFDGEESIAYTGGTMVYSKYDRDMSVSEILPGDVFDVYTSKDGQKLSQLKESKNIIEKENVNVSVDSGKKQMTVDGVTYAYSDQMVVISDGKPMEPMELMATDQVTFRGVKGQAYSIILTKGHGYIQPSHYSDFVGGTLTVQGEAILPVSKNMLLLVPEGTQTLMMANGDYTGTATVEVKRNQVTKLDMSEFQAQVADVARVTFKIEPEGAELYVNGSLTDASKKVSLKYGKHSVKVVLEGYNDYSGIIQVKDPSPVIRINLAEETAEVSDEDSSDSSVSDSDSTTSTADVDYDTDHQITVSAPSGAAVYVDGTYKGVAPCSFTKMLGSVKLTLTKDGYTTKSYSLEISDDDKDVSWSFPDLAASTSG